MGADSPERAAAPVRIAVFVSGSGTNLQALLDHFNTRESPLARVALVVANRDGIQALERAERAGVPAVVIGTANQEAATISERMLAVLEEHRIQLIVLAGYLKLVPPDVVARYRGRMLNIHPALLPAFGGPGMYGLRVHQAVIASGARVSGATVHLVDDRYDEGRIVAQWPVPVAVGDTAEELAARVLRVEHMLLPAAVEALITAPSSEGLQGFEAFELKPARSPDPYSVRKLTI